MRFEEGGLMRPVPAIGVADCSVGRGLCRLGWLGTIAAATLVGWLAAARNVLGLASPRPPLPLVGWELLRSTVELDGHAELVFRLCLGLLWLAVPLAVATRGFRQASWPGRAAVLAVGLAGLGAAIPMVCVVAVMTTNAVLLAVAVLFAALLLLFQLLRLLTWPFRR
jgi:hypothetical protein